MANEIQFRHTGSVGYAVVRRLSDGYVWNGSTFVVSNDSSYASYDITINATANDAGLFIADFPALITAAGIYAAELFETAGATRTADELPILSGQIAWDGSAEVHLMSIDTLLDTINAKTATISGSSVSVVSPVRDNGEIEIVRGDSYLSADGTAIVVTIDTYGGPSITGATAAFYVADASDYDDGSSAGNAVGTVTLAMSGADLVVTIQLTASQTESLSPSPPAEVFNYVYSIQITTASATIHTPATGPLYVKREVG